MLYIAVIIALSVPFVLLVHSLCTCPCLTCVGLLYNVSDIVYINNNIIVLAVHCCSNSNAGACCFCFCLVHSLCACRVVAVQHCIQFCIALKAGCYKVQDLINLHCLFVIIV